MCNLVCLNMAVRLGLVGWCNTY